MADDKNDPPIQPQNFLGGVTVVNIGDVRVARGLSRRHHSSCPHRQIVYDRQERRIWCQDCERDIEPFDAFTRLTEGYAAAVSKLKAREQVIAEAEKFKIISIAAKSIDRAWRKRNMVPACPHCKNGLFPEDFRKIGTMLGRDYALARLGRKP